MLQDTLEADGAAAPLIPRGRIALRPLTLALVASVWFALFANGSFWARIFAGIADAQSSPVVTTLATFALLVSLQFILFALLFNRWTVKPLLAVLLLVSASASYFMGRFGIYFDTAMLRNVLATDLNETLELLSPGMALHLLVYAGLPLLALTRVDVRAGTARREWWLLPVALGVAVVVAALALFAAGNQLVPQLREHHEIRYLVTPGNVVASAVQLVTAGHGPRAGEALLPVGTDARKIAAPAQPPTVLVIVVGETVRAQNWGLNGYARQTTPQLAARDVLNFQHVTACGTNTETSLPCMFSVYGRRHYDEVAIRNSESLLHVAHHAGVNVIWRDNQSGCKGVCEGLPHDNPLDIPAAPLCNGDGCLDEALLIGLREKILAANGDMLIVLHQMGNHGPAYFQRYPQAFRQFSPACETNELWTCSDEQIVNAYDNAILYTDDMLAKTIDMLAALSPSRRTALIYVSDHGESLGEQGIYLHSLPRAIAPDTQTHVPMVAWFSPGFLSQRGIDRRCLEKTTTAPVSHDNLFHTALGVLGVSTSVYDASLDVLSACRS